MTLSDLPLPRGTRQSVDSYSARYIRQLKAVPKKILKRQQRQSESAAKTCTCFLSLSSGCCSARREIVAKDMDILTHRPAVVSCESFHHLTCSSTWSSKGRMWRWQPMPSCITQYREDLDIKRVCQKQGKALHAGLHMLQFLENACDDQVHFSVACWNLSEYSRSGGLDAQAPTNPPPFFCAEQRVKKDSHMVFGHSSLRMSLSFRLPA